MFLCNSMNVFFRHWKFMSRISSVLLAFFGGEFGFFFILFRLKNINPPSYRIVLSNVQCAPNRRKKNRRTPAEHSAVGNHLQTFVSFVSTK